MAINPENQNRFELMSSMLEDHTEAKPSSYNMDKYLYYIAYVCVY